MKEFKFSIFLFSLIFSSHLVLAQNSPPLMVNFIGTNMQAKGNPAFYTKFGFLREYHSWGADIGLSTDSEVRCPKNLYHFNPSYDHSTLLNNDNFYDLLSGRVSPALIDLAPEMRGITAYLGACEKYHTQKPICGENLVAPFNTCDNEHIDWVGWFYDANSSSFDLGKIGAISSENPITISLVNTQTENAPSVKVYVRIDWNNDGDFDDLGEDVEMKDITAAPGLNEVVFAQIETPTNASGLTTMRIVVANGDTNPFSNNGSTYGWFDGDAVDYPVYFSNGGSFTVLDPTAITGYNLTESGHFYIQSISLPGINDLDKDDLGYENLTKNLSFLEAGLLSSSSTSFILEKKTTGATNWGLSFDESPLPTTPSTLPNSYLISGTFTSPNITAGIHHLTIAYGATQTNILVVKQGLCPSGGCSTNVGSLSAPSEPLQRFQLNPIIDQQDPMTYYEYAKWNSLLTSKYAIGTTESIHDNYKDLEAAPTSPVPSMAYIEVGNEEDAYWWDLASEQNTPNTQIQMLPGQYGAMLSAAYDGGCNTMTYNGENLGIHNVSSDIKVVLAGLTGLRGQYVEDLVSYFEKTRTGSNCSGHILPFDVLNFHHYTTLPAIDEDNDYTATFDKMYGEYNFAPSKGHGVSPEESRLKWMVEQTLERITSSTDITQASRDELKTKEVWFSEFGYDTGVPSPDSWATVPTVGNNTQQETQAQWIVRSFLELAAVNANDMQVTKAMVFDLEDRRTGGNYLFADCGLIKDKAHNNAPKKSWFHVQTMRNVLGETTYQGEFTGQKMELISGAFDFSEEARIYHFKGTYKGATDVDILAIWSPNSSDSKGTLTLDFKQSVFDNLLLTLIQQVTIVTPRDGDEDGYHQSFTKKHDEPFVFSRRTVPVTETPMFVILNRLEDEEQVNCPEFKVSRMTADSITFDWEVFYDKKISSTMDIYYETNPITNSHFDISNAKLHLAVKNIETNRHQKQITIGGIDLTQKQLFYVVAKKNKGVINTCPMGPFQID